MCGSGGGGVRDNCVCQGVRGLSSVNFLCEFNKSEFSGGWGGASRFAYGEFTVETMDTYDEKKVALKFV